MEKGWIGEMVAAGLVVVVVVIVVVAASAEGVIVKVCATKTSSSKEFRDGGSGSTAEAEAAAATAATAPTAAASSRAAPSPLFRDPCRETRLRLGLGGGEEVDEGDLESLERRDWISSAMAREVSSISTKASATAGGGGFGSTRGG